MSETIEQRLDEILIKLENEVSYDTAKRIQQHSSGKSPKQSHAEAKQALLQLLNEAEKNLLQELLLTSGVNIDVNDWCVARLSQLKENNQ